MAADNGSRHGEARPVLVIGPVHESKPEELRALGETLQRWQSEHPWLTRLSGLTQLLEGMLPRTPSRELGLSYVPGHETYEPVVLVYAAADPEEVYRTAAAVLSRQPARIGWFISPANYNGMMA